MNGIIMPSGYLARGLKLLLTFPELKVESGVVWEGLKVTGVDESVISL